ncbi:amidohydrolase family protein [Kribbella sp. CA-294648]|uniref:amidohydrolase family protein n=1 Tax=Kribbella sp. CA-294648 TaxID=3239948 RepID=UPI003D8D3286
MPDHTGLDPATLKYLSAGSIAIYGYVVEQLYKANRTAAEISRQRQMWEYRQRFVRELFAHGVPVLAGTDTGTPYMVPGFALHDELELLVKAGATTQQALYSATVEPAGFLGMSAHLGSVESRKIADLVVLDGDPLKDIINTRRIHTVVTRGRIISRPCVNACSPTGRQPSRAPRQQPVWLQVVAAERAVPDTNGQNRAGCDRTVTACAAR